MPRVPTLMKFLMKLEGIMNYFAQIMEAYTTVNEVRVACMHERQFSLEMKSIQEIVN